jgi:hypothetical protein
MISGTTSGLVGTKYTICPADNATAGCMSRRRAGQLRFGFVAVLKGHIVYKIEAWSSTIYAWCQEFEFDFFLKFFLNFKRKNFNKKT